MALRKSQRSLRAWSKQDWGTKSGKKSSETGERYLPKAARDALKAAFDNGYQTAGHKIAEDREDEGRKKLTKDEVKGAILKAYPSLRELNREIIEQEIMYTKMAGLLSAYTSAYNTVSRIVTLRTNGNG